MLLSYWEGLFSLVSGRVANRGICFGSILAQFLPVSRPHLHRTGEGIDQEMRHASLAAGWCCVLLIRGDWVQIGKGLLCGGYAKNATLEEHPGLRKNKKNERLCQ